LMYLLAHCRLCQPQLRTRPGKAPLTGNEPEVKQVMVIDPFHRQQYYFDYDEA
jgi:hypothetical protein